MVSLREAGVLGVAGPKPRIQALARWLVAQAATLHSPRDLSVVVLAERDGEAPWSWVRWLPHARPGEGSDCLVSVGNDRETVRARVSELLALVAARRIQLEERRSLGGTRFADVVVVMDGARVLRSLPGVATLVQDGPAVGVHAICLDEAASLLPPECSTVVEFEAGESRVTVSRSGEEEIAGVVADQVSRAWADQVGRALAAVRDASAVDEAGGLPDAVRLVDLLEIEPPAAGAVLAGWAAGGRTTEAAVGVAADGPLALDLRRDGPHALVAGTTGAGKSELLQTWIASLAVANRPDALSFVLVDYKGGSAFREASSLPHVVGMVTDLDGHQTERALASLTAELKRREILLAGAEASDIDTYWRRSDRAGGALPALPRLVIVVDEFASLVEELPDFVRGLVGIAQRGRSLGVHLVLATQRPGGSVSPEIRANTNLRIALRMTDASESSDVINAGDAARIPQSAPGRAYVRTGHATLVAFQAARVGGRRRGSGAGAAAPIAVAVSWPMLGRPLPQPRAGQPEEREDTDLSAVVGAVREAAERQPGEPPIRPWLPPLPERLQLSALWADAPRVAVAPLALGLQDLPDQQTQASFSLDLERGGHLMIVGSPGSGRSTVLRTLAGAVAERTSAADVHLYVLDCGNRALACIEALPHCGAVVTRSETERTERLLSRLLEEVADRQHLLSSRGFADVAEQRAAVPPAERLPYILVLLDRWEGFMSAFEELDGGRLPGEFIRLLREGASAGVKVVLTGDRSALTGRVASAVEDRIVLRMNDRSDYGLLGLNQRALPDSIPPGRGFLAESGTEVQFALLTEDDSGVAQVAALQAVAASASERERDVAPERGPRPVALLPNRLTAAQLAYLVDGRRPPSPLTAVLGVGGDSLEPVVLDLGLEGPGCLIAGARRSGRSTALVTIARSLLRAGAQVVILAPRPSPLVDLDGDPGVSAVLTGLEVTEADVLERVGMASGPMVMCIDDAELLNETPVASAVQAVLRSARDRSHAVVAAGTPEDLAGFRGFVPELRKSRTGLLLNPAAPSDGEPLGMRVPRTALSPGPPGRALLVAGGTVTTVQLPALD
jgi:S-DNA-T family DNA segregation ATPase FtsK/SpoIIIE